METVLESRSKTVVIGPDRPFCVIGERINPTGRKKFQAELQKGDLSRIEVDVAQQVAGGADMLDVNVGDPLADEIELMRQAIPLVQGLTDLPLCIDSSVIEALEAGLGAYEGKALVNSVTGEDERLGLILPIVARHGAAVIGLANDDEIPMEPERRLEVARKIVSVAGDHGIPPEDVLIDPLADEIELMRSAIPLVQGLTDVPLCIDSSVIEALEAGLGAYEGKALVNSVTGEDERLDAILPIVAKYGAAVIGLANDDEIPMEPKRRLEVARKIVSRAGDYGIPPENVLIDPLAMPVGAEPRAVTLFLETVRLIRDELGVNMTCGASNTSFGLPGRETLGAAFLAVAASHGLTSAIMDARSREIVEAVRATDFLLGHDEWGAAWIAAYRAKKAAAEAAAVGVTEPLATG